MSIKRRFTKEELDKLLRRSEETPIDELANELNMKRKALYKHIYAYKTELEFKKRFEEILGSYIEKPKGKPTLVPKSDNRPAIQTAGDDFNEI